MKMKFKENLIDIMLRAKAVHCDTVKKAEILLKELAKYGVKWKDGVDLTPSDTTWNLLKNETCYVLTTLMKPHDLAYWTCEDCQMSDYKIVEFDELLDDEQEDDNNNNLVIKVNDIIHDLIDYANKKCEKTIHTAEAYRDGYIKGCKDSLGEVRAILSEIKSNGRKE